MKSDEYVRFLTREFVRYLEEPREFRKVRRAEKKLGRVPGVNPWFGMIPAAISHSMNGLFRKMRGNRQNK